VAAPVSRRTFLQAGAGLSLAVATGVRAQSTADLLPTGKASGQLLRPNRPLLMAHRGCSAKRPEHTLGAYAQAIADGADLVEPDLVCTKDGELIARHENNIAETTDIAQHPEFASRKTTKTIDGVRQEGWFTEDFTLAELRTLRARERLTGMREESHGYDGVFRLCTLGEIADFVAAESAARGRLVGLIPELKHSTYFAGIGLQLEPRLMAELAASLYLRRCPVIIQSFEVNNLKTLRKSLQGFTNVRLMQLVGDPREQPWDLQASGSTRSYLDMVSEAGLTDIASYADYVAPPTRMLIPIDGSERLARPSGLVEAAHAAGLLVGTWTFRPENRFIAADFRDGGTPDARNERGSIAEMQRYLATGLDGFFTDDPALGLAARNLMGI